MTLGFNQPYNQTRISYNNSFSVKINKNKIELNKDLILLYFISSCCFFLALNLPECCIIQKIERSYNETENTIWFVSHRFYLI